MKIRFIAPLILLIQVISQPSAWAWGRHGHAVICEVAASLVRNEPKGDFLKNQSYNLSYYCNVPDLVWKKPATYSIEETNHYLDIEIFDRAFKAINETTNKPYELDRKTFNKTYPQIPEKAGRIWWRIQEINAELMGFREKLMAKDNDKLKKEDRDQLQHEWMIRAGVLGHYIGDLSMPMHLSENHDGQLTDQKGIHQFYEDVMVDEILHSPGYGLFAEVRKVAESRWQKERKALEKKSILDLIQAESKESHAKLDEALKLDKKMGRDIKKVMPAYKKILVERLAAGAVYLAEYYRRAIGFDFSEVYRFYNWSGTPDYIHPPK